MTNNMESGSSSPFGARTVIGLLVTLTVVMAGAVALATEVHPDAAEPAFPPSLASYGDSHFTSVGAILRNRIAQQPFNLWATLLFLGAIVHTFLTHRFLTLAHRLEERHQQRLIALVCFMVLR